MVLTGAHPFQLWTELPGPRGWFPMVFFLLAILCFPVWVCFHAGTIGTLLAWLTGTEHLLRSGAFYVWRTVTLLGVLVLVFGGGYATLERTQLIIVALMLLSVLISLWVVKPDWLEFLKGLLVPHSLTYPNWARAHPEIVGRPRLGRNHHLRWCHRWLGLRLSRLRLLLARQTLGTCRKTQRIACGFICLLNHWVDRRFMPSALRMHWSLFWLNLIGGAVFIGLGFKAYWDHSGWLSSAILAGTLAAGWFAAQFFKLSFARAAEAAIGPSNHSGR